jgi:MoaA/NifB/PqqE/SkfB family radical SAM enzyme
MKKIKHFFNLLKFLCGSTRPISGPFKVQWELTYACNLRCLHCHLWQISAGIKPLPLEREKEIITQLARSGVLNLSFSGGEMFLRKDIFDLILYVVGNSNGWLIDEAMAQEIVRSGLDQLYLSLDGPREIHDELRGTAGAYDHVISAIKNLKKFQKNGRPKIFINFVVNRKNFRHLIETAREVYQLGADGFTVEPVHGIEKYSPEADLILRPDDWPEFQEEIEKFLNTFEGKLPHLSDYIRHFEIFIKNKESLKKIRCLAGYGTLQIHPNGDVFPCPAAFYKIGNLAQDDFEKIWKSEPARICRKLIKRGHHPACWFTCVAPLNLFLSYFSWRCFLKLFNPRFIGYLRQKSKV